MFSQLSPTVSAEQLRERKPGDGGMPQGPNIPATSVLLIDGSMHHRAYWADQLQRSSPDYLIVEAEDRESGLALYRSRRSDCVVLDLALSISQASNC